MKLDQFQPDRMSGQPMYKQLTDFISTNIDSGTLMSGDRLPTERAVSEALSLSRGTVRSAYGMLEQKGIIVSRRGSGSYVADIPRDKAERNRRDAVQVINDAIDSMEGLEMAPDEMLGLFRFCLTARQSDKTVTLAVIGQSQEALLDIKRQLSYMENVSVSLFILDSIITLSDPKGFFSGYDLAVTLGCYEAVAQKIPEIRNKLVETAVSPSQETMLDIFSLEKSARIGIICRTNDFLATVRNTLKTYGFRSENIQSFFEMDYTTETYFPGGIHALISFSDAHIFTNESFIFRNEELIAKGGRLIRFVSNLERGSIIYIENRIQSFLQDTEINKKKRQK